MSLSRPSIEWRLLEDSEAQLSNPQISDDAEIRHDERIPPDQGNTNLGRLYELLLAIALIYGFAVFWVWQRTEQTIALLADDVVALQKEIKQTGDEVSGSIEYDKTKIYNFETDYLRFEASELTATLVETILQSCDTKYKQLHQDFGVALPTPNEKLVIYVDHQVSSSYESDRTLIVLFPDKVIKQNKASEVDAMRNTVYRGLSEHVLNRALMEREIRFQWKAMTTALQAYVQLENSHYKNWKNNAIYLPNRRLATDKSLSYVLQTDVLSENGIYLYQSIDPGRVADPLIEYIIEVYGYSQIAPLLDGFEFHKNWATLAPAVFDISASELEKEWHMYLENEYSISKN